MTKRGKRLIKNNSPWQEGAPPGPTGPAPLVCLNFQKKKVFFKKYPLSFYEMGYNKSIKRKQNTFYTEKIKMRKRNYKAGKFNWREEMDRKIAKKQQLAERLAAIDAFFESKKNNEEKKEEK